MTRKSWVAVTVVLVPWLALARPGNKEGAEQQPREAERMERAEKRMRLRQVLTLSDALELDNAQALKMEETLRRFDEKRRPLREQVRDAARTLHQAARGDSAALAQVDAAAQRAFEARERIAALDREMYQALAKELAPEKRAKLALALARGGGVKTKRFWKNELPGDSRGED
ncbi:MULTISPECIES: hypothetical protein [Myxococcus]|uniref:Periplasmic heavy metal sensor n=1 Tax=Myxococcus llanfairpwllgwyngyllgogerychwyrndrobwllllantysiliogogogochensis TaxID=2590453 RepID=A0A540X3D8_9BACT|nr:MULTISPECIES: hypothetical protein [Myxococcus]NTX04358.1 hypothetical protein [Myxococcus sp. CA040A]NTX13019.1 hypothetical protein [Myxococcus sp. CA056]NTX50116.1 hypothetical protein [Myxococcus sp. CA039A]TQF15781.1 hypothetical protein FJV41_11905 [Myxococcus llanfairpwllgwyngyllgogerychwyrndrobwllllantysiliogogogochensis]